MRVDVSLGDLEGYRQHAIERQEKDKLEIYIERDLRLILRRNHCGPKISKSVTVSQFCKGVSGDLFQEYINKYCDAVHCVYFHISQLL